MHTTNEQLFLVNGKESRLTIEPDSIVWSQAAAINSDNSSSSATSSSPTATATKHDNSEKNKPTAADRLSFAQIIGTNHGRLQWKGGKKHNNNKSFKLYYAKDNELKSTRQLLKIKSLTIECLQSSLDDSPTTANYDNHDNPRQSIATCLSAEVSGANDTSKSASTNEGQATSEPPSCYASEGSTSHLSSLSACSSPVQVLVAAAAAATTTDSVSGAEQNEKRPLSESGSSSSSPPVTLDDVCRLIESRIERERQQKRPRRLLIFVNPYGGKGKAVRLYKSKVRRLFDIANVETKLVITNHANHARDTIEDPMFNVEYFDAIICIGGDGMFSELMNGLLFRYNREKILSVKPDNQQQLNTTITAPKDDQTSLAVQQKPSSTESSGSGSDSSTSGGGGGGQRSNLGDRDQGTISEAYSLESLRSALGGIGQPLVSPPVPIGVIGAGSTDANSFGLIGTNDVVTATLNIILGKQIHIDVCSIHTIDEDRLLRFVSTFVAYGYFGDVIRESEKLRWLGPSRYDVTGVNNLIKNRAYQGRVRILVSSKDGSPKDTKRCHANCDLCKQLKDLPKDSELKFINRQGSFVGVNAAVTACRCPQTKKGFSPNNHLANGCVDLILVRPCSRMQYIQYLVRTGWTKKSAFDLKYIEAYRCRQFEFFAHHDTSSESHLHYHHHHHHMQADRPLAMSSGVFSSSSSAISSSSASNSSSLESKNRASITSSPASNASGTSFSSWNVDGEILDEASIRVKVNNKLLRVFGTGEPTFGAT